MENRLWSDIQAQGENLAAVLNHLYGAERQRLEEAARFLAGSQPIVFIGVASAEYLSMPAAVYLSQHGRPATTLCAAEALYTHLPALGASRVVLNTRSGETAEIVRLGQALKEAGIPFLALTNEPRSSAARLASAIVWTHTRKDDLVSINVVSGMLSTALALAAAACGELDAQQALFQTLPQVMAEAVERASTRGAEFERWLGERRPLYQLYRGASRGSAHCARLVLEEVARTPGVAMDAAEFRQGPNEVVDERFAACVYAPDGQPGELNRALARDILRCGGRVLLVGPPADLNAQPGLLTFDIPGLPDWLRPVVEVVPAQILAYHRAQAQGYTPGSTRYITKIILSESGIPNQA